MEHSKSPEERKQELFVAEEAFIQAEFDELKNRWLSCATSRLMRLAELIVYAA